MRWCKSLCIESGIWVKLSSAFCFLIQQGAARTEKIFVYLYGNPKKSI